MWQAVGKKNPKTFQWIVMTFSGDADDGRRERWFNFGEVLDSGGALTIDGPKIIGQDQKFIEMQANIICKQWTSL